MTSVVIVGSGLAGLVCVARLAGRARCTIVERLPMLGGEHWDDREVRALKKRALAGDTTVFAGAQAIRWDGANVTVIGQDSCVMPADALVIATGHRPMTRGEMGIAGERCGGVVPGTVAQHLLHHGVCVGHRPLVIGGGRMAVSLVRTLAARGCDTMLAVPGSDAPSEALPGGIRTALGAVPVSVHGNPRVERVAVRSGDGSERMIDCDALILAHGRAPYRNVDGAIFDAPGVVFAQSGTEEPAASIAAGEAAAEAALTLERAGAHFHLTPRIGVPA